MGLKGVKGFENFKMRGGMGCEKMGRGRKRYGRMMMLAGVIGVKWDEVNGFFRLG